MVASTVQQVNVRSKAQTVGLIAHPRLTLPDIAFARHHALCPFEIYLDPQRQQ